MEIILLILAILAIPAGVIVLFVQVLGLKRRVEQLEARLVAQGNAVASSPVAVEPVAQELPAPVPEEPPVAPAPWAETEPDAVAAQPARPEAAPTPWERASARAKSKAKADGTVAPERQPSLPPAPSGPSAFDRFGRWLKRNWVYVVSAASLSLAGIFLVQYGVERGLLPPGARVLAALLFGGGLIAAGERFRRRYGDEGDMPTVNLPSVFSGAGIVTIFGAILAARSLYSLIGPEVAFAGHLATAALAVAIGWFSGPLLVAVGLIGATVAPFVVGGNSTTLDWLYAYFALLATTGFAVDAVRRWRWVSVLALVLSYGAAVLVLQDAGSTEGWIAYLVVMVLLATILPELRLIPTHAGPTIVMRGGAKRKGRSPSFTVILAAAAMAVSCIQLLIPSSDDAATVLLLMAALTALALAYLLWAERADGLADLPFAPTATLLGLVAMTGARLDPIWQDFHARDLSLRAPESPPSLTASFLLAMTTLISLGFAYRALRSRNWFLPYGLAATLTAPVSAVLLELLWMPAKVLGPAPWALHVIALAAVMTGLAVQFARRDRGDMRRAAHATLSALSLIALALFVVTTKTALTLALAVLVVVAAALDRRFRLPEMGLFVQVGAAVLGWRLLADPGIDWALQAPLLEVLLAFGGAILALGGAAFLLRPLDRPLTRAVADSAALGLTTILANVLITRWLDSGTGVRLESHWGVTLNSLPWMVFMLVQLYRAGFGGRFARLRQIMGGLGGLIAGAGLFGAVTAANPLFAVFGTQAGAEVRGPMVLDTLALAYALPGLILLLAAWKMARLQNWVRWGFVIVGAALATLYVGLEIRRFWQGDWLGVPGVKQGELYTYTLAMMLVGAGLLYQAIATRSDRLRRIAMAVIGLVIAKVFLIDAAGLTGLTRVFSFTGLGLSLAGLAWLNRWVDRAGKGRDAPPAPGDVT